MNKFMLIIGGNRCGSTSLFRYLSEHPQIIASFEKETRFFLDENYDIGRHSSLFYDGKLQTYLKFFPKIENRENGFWYLDSSPDYLYSTETAVRIKNFFGEDKIMLIALLRDPIDRFLSWYHYDKQLGNIADNMSLMDYYMQNIKGGNLRQYNRLITGCYSLYLEEYMRLFPDKLHLYRFEQLANMRDVLINDLLGKAGLEQNHVSSDFVYNASKEVKFVGLNRLYFFLRRSFQNYVPQNSGMYRLLKRASKEYQKFNYGNIKREPVNENLLSQLKAYYQNEYDFLDRTVGALV